MKNHAERKRARAECTSSRCVNSDNFLSPSLSLSLSHIHAWAFGDFHPAFSDRRAIKRSITLSAVCRWRSRVNRTLVSQRFVESDLAVPETFLPPLSLALSSRFFSFFFFFNVRPRVCTLITENHRGRDTVKWIMVQDRPGDASTGTPPGTIGMVYGA